MSGDRWLLCKDQSQETWTDWDFLCAEVGCRPLGAPFCFQCDLEALRRVTPLWSRLGASGQELGPKP